MSLTTTDVTHLLIALTLLVAAAHALGHVFAVLRQPPVIGEILGGLLLGPTVLGALAPDLFHRLFPATGPVAAVLGAVYELGLLLLMFLVGSELRIHAEPGERRTVAGITLAGLALPFLVGMIAVRAFDPARFVGPHGSAETFGVIFSIAIAVTSIPVISRIMMDLGILDTGFARVVLTAAVLEDLVLYTVLAVVLGLADARAGVSHGLWALAGSDSAALTAGYYIAASLLFFAVMFLYAPAVFRLLAGSRFNGVQQRSPTAFRLLLLFTMVLMCAGLGINPIFGALVAGAVCARVDAKSAYPERRADRAWAPLKQFSLAFFIPVYFAVVGLKLNLIRDFDPAFFCWFILIACVAKWSSVWAGARLVGESPRSAADIAVAMNARGGPGIVLATVTFGAGLINERFFTALVLLSILTSQLAGYWLDRVFTRRAEPGSEPGTESGSGAGRVPLAPRSGDRDPGGDRVQ